MKNNKTDVFKDELALIKSKDVKELAKDIINGADDWFFIEPASSSGKYHPDFAREVGGLVLHTKAVVYFLNELVRSELYDVTEREVDLLILSAIAHDIKKFGDVNNGHTVKNHPELGAKYVKTINEQKCKIPSSDMDFVEKCIISHMGVWGDVKPTTEAEKLLHISDLLASRKEIDLKFSKESRKTITPSLDDYVLDFGMHRGKTLKEVPNDYLEWGIKSIDKNPVFKKLAKQVLEERKQEVKV